MWLQDPELCRCSAAARGVWIDILCLMFQSDERGVLVSCGEAWTVEETARALRGDSGACLSSVKELLERGVMRRRNDGALYCARMVRDREQSDAKAQSGRKGGLAKAKQKASKHPSKPLTVIVTSQSNSSRKEKEVQEERARTLYEHMQSDVLKTDAFRDAWSDWENHRKEIKKPLTKTSVKRQIRLLESWGERRGIAAIHHTILKGWTGIREPDGNDEFAGPGRVKSEPGKYDNLKVIHAPAKHPS